MAMRDITDLMNTYRECSRNLWNVYFSRRENVGACLDAFGEIQRVLFDSLVVDQLCSEMQTEDEVSIPTLKIVPRLRSLILIKRLGEPGESGYWDQEKDMVVGPDEITLEFLDYFDFSQVPIKELRYYRCRVLSFPSRVEYEGREALIETLDARVIHDEHVPLGPRAGGPGK